MKKTIILLISTLIIFQQPLILRAENENKDSEETLTEDLLKSLDYPELQVVPRASERLKEEAKNESDFGWGVHWTFQLSALSTLAVGMTAKSYYRKDVTENGVKVSSGLSEEDLATANQTAEAMKIIGGGWFVGMTILSFMQPYRSGYKNLSKFKGNDKRRTLMRERLAEETLESSANLIHSLRWLSIFSNFAVNAYMLDKVSGSGTANSLVAMMAAFAPAYFQHLYIENYEKQQDYKRKIYAPVVSLLLKPKTEQMQAYEPMLTLNWTY